MLHSLFCPPTHSCAIHCLTRARNCTINTCRSRRIRMHIVLATGLRALLAVPCPMSDLRKKITSQWRLYIIYTYSMQCTHCPIKEIMGLPPFRRTFELGKFISPARKSIINLVKLWSLVKKERKMWQMQSFKVCEFYDAPFLTNQIAIILSWIRWIIPNTSLRNLVRKD
jgi:hypothetical protein